MRTEAEAKRQEAMDSSNAVSRASQRSANTIRRRLRALISWASQSTFLAAPPLPAPRRLTSSPSSKDGAELKCAVAAESRTSSAIALLSRRFAPVWLDDTRESREERTGGVRWSG